MTKEPQIFRRWLIDGLLRTPWTAAALECRTEEELEQLAIGLGVDFLVLEEVRQGSAAAGAAPPAGVRNEPGSFRSWLIEQLLGSHWARFALACHTEEELEKLGAELGVDFDVLEEVRQRSAAEQHAHGRKPSTGTKTGLGAGAAYPQIRIDMPASVKQLWKQYTESLHINATTAVRSAIHEYLLAREEPDCDDRWFISGVQHEFDAGKKPMVQPSITPGAIGVLRRRARARGTSLQAIVRQLMTECLEGTRVIQRPTPLQGMFNDPERYFLPVAPTRSSDGPEGSSDEP